jgi:hypothetical protein
MDLKMFLMIDLFVGLWWVDKDTMLFCFFTQITRHFNLFCSYKGKIFCKMEVAYPDEFNL